MKKNKITTSKLNIPQVDALLKLIVFYIISLNSFFKHSRCNTKNA